MDMNINVDMWTCGRTNAWTHERLNTWTAGRTDAWTHGRLDIDIDMEMAKLCYASVQRNSPYSAVRISYALSRRKAQIYQEKYLTFLFARYKDTVNFSGLLIR
jgi:hypothetical protein